MESVLGKREFRYTRTDFRRVQSLIGEFAGINLSEEKTEFVYARLAKIVRGARIDSIGALLDLVEAGSSEYRTPFINALTTNLTSFFREPHHFDEVARFVNGRRQSPRIWSAACSTGAEPYSIAITLFEANLTSCTILATDIDTNCLERTRAGIYDLDEIEGLDAGRKRRWFLRGTGKHEGRTRVVRPLRDALDVRHHNLVNDKPRGTFDIIFCRNVLMYFDRSTQRGVLETLHDALSPEGLLMVGHAEHPSGVSDLFAPVGRTTYRRR